MEASSSSAVGAATVKEANISSEEGAAAWIDPLISSGRDRVSLRGGQDLQRWHGVALGGGQYLQRDESIGVERDGDRARPLDRLDVVVDDGRQDLQRQDAAVLRWRGKDL
jgi:hypothetical protein